jgi:hypothetical protein
MRYSSFPDKFGATGLLNSYRMRGKIFLIIMVAIMKQSLSDNQSPRKHPCPDCKMCQGCSQSRCKSCRAQRPQRRRLSLQDQIALFNSLNPGLDSDDKP